MAALVIAEHDNHVIKGGTLNAVAAAAKCGGEVTVLVAGSGCGDAAKAAAAIAFTCLRCLTQLYISTPSEQMANPLRFTTVR